MAHPYDMTQEEWNSLSNEEKESLYPRWTNPSLYETHCEYTAQELPDARDQRFGAFIIAAIVILLFFGFNFS